MYIRDASNSGGITHDRVEDGVDIGSDGKFYTPDPQYRFWHGPYDTIEEARGVRESLEKSLAEECDGLGEV